MEKRNAFRHYLGSRIDAINNGKVTSFIFVGKLGNTYIPERSLWIYANWKPNQELDTWLVRFLYF